MVDAVPSAANLWTAAQLHFQAWLALPTGLRQPKQQRDLAKEIGVHESTLSDWKRLTGWNEAVYDLAREHVMAELVPVLHAQVVQAKKGSLAHAQWVFEVLGKWTPKQKFEHSTPDGFSIEVKAVDYRDGLAAVAPTEGDA